MELEPLFIDNHLLVVTKPAGMLAQADQTGDVDLLSLCRRYVEVRFEKPGRAYLGLVHRLDRPVSGVMVFARTSKAAQRLSRQFRDGSVGKRYLAVVEGFMEGTARSEDFLLKVQRRVKVVRGGTRGARRASLEWRSVGSTGRASLVEVLPATGRQHQIRAQLAALGHPIVGDLRYGAATEFDGRNLALHCLAIDIEHPTRGERLVFTAPLPPSWYQRFPAFGDLLAASVREAEA